MDRRQQREGIKGAAGCATATIPVGMVLAVMADAAAGPVAGIAVAGIAAAFFAGAVWLTVRMRRELDAAPPPLPHSRSIPQWVKIAVATRDGGKCRSCGSAYELQYDHVIPYSRGGSSTDVNNIQLLCGTCNRRKSNRYVG